MRDSQMLFGKSLAITGALGLLVSANYLAYQREQFTKEIFAFFDWWHIDPDFDDAGTGLSAARDGGRLLRAFASAAGAFADFDEG